LATVREPQDVERAVRSAVGVEPEGAARPLTEDLKPLESLVVLDNCEHLIDECAELAEAIVTSCPSLRLLTTSREPLHASGEVAWRVPSLGFPSVDEPLGDVTRHAAVRLFVDRAQAADASFQLRAEDAGAVAQICRRLDGLPLAIELAAARTRSLSPTDLAARLDDRLRLLTGGRRRALERQQTLRAAVDWSHDLLSEAQQVLLRRLAVFTGTFALDDVEGVCSGDGVEEKAVLDLMDHLVDASLVVAEHAQIGTRYRLLETIREYAQEKAVNAGEAANLRDRHLDHLVAGIRRLRDEPPTDSEAHWDRALADYPNLRAAWSWAMETGRTSLVLLLGVGMAPYWWEQVSDEGGEWTREILEIIDTGQPDAGEAAFALGTAAHWARFVPNDFELTLELVERGIPLAEEAGDDGSLAGHLMLKGLTLPVKQRGPVLERAIAIGRSAGYEGMVAMALWGLRAVAREDDDVEREREIMREAVAAAGSAPSTLSAILLRDAAVVEWRAGDPRRAREIAQEAVSAARSPRTLYNIAQEIAPRDPDLGREICQQSLEMMGSRRHGLRPNAMLGIAEVDLGQGRLEEAREGAERVLVLAREMGKESSLISAEYLLAEIALVLGDTQEARRHAEEVARAARRAGVDEKTALYAKAGVDLSERDLDAAADSLAEALELALKPSDVDYVLRILPLDVYERMAQVEAARGGHERSATLLGQSHMLRRRDALPRPLVHQPAFDALRDELERELGEVTYRAAVERGTQMTADDAKAFALDRQ
jgi:predicted ATPase